MCVMCEVTGFKALVTLLICEKIKHAGIFWLWKDKLTKVGHLAVTFCCFVVKLRATG